jgi:hypothetical protein
MGGVEKIKNIRPVPGRDGLFPGKKGKIAEEEALCLRRKRKNWKDPWQDINRKSTMFPRRR